MELTKEISENKSIVSEETNRTIDEFEKLIVDNFVPVECPITHHFAPEIYIREMFASAGSLLTSKVHKTEHLFIVSKGVLKVWDEENKEHIISAPYIGKTKSGTRRAAEVMQDVIWSTVHSIPFITGEEELLSLEEQEKIVDEIEKIVIEPHVNLLLNQEKEMKTLNEKEGVECRG